MEEIAKRASRRSTITPTTRAANKQQQNPTSRKGRQAEKNDDGDSEAGEDDDADLYENVDDEAEETTLGHVQAQASALLTVSVPAIRSDVKLSEADQNRLDQLLDTFTRKTREARESLEDGLKDLGVLLDDGGYVKENVKKESQGQLN